MKIVNTKARGITTAVPVIASLALVLAACGGGSNSAQNVAQQPGTPVTDAAPAAPSTTGADTAAKAAPATDTGTAAAPAAAPAKSATKAKAATAVAPKAAKAGSATKAVTAPKAAAGTATESDGKHSIDTAAQAAENEKIAASKDGATDIGVTKDSIKFGTVNMHGMALGNVLITPMVNGVRAALSAINDRGGVLGRRMSIIDCDDGPGEVARSKACIKKLVGQDHIFSMVTAI